MLFSKGLKFNSALMQKLQQVADKKGISVEKYAAEVLEAAADEELEKMEVQNQLKGLGYIE